MERVYWDVDIEKKCQGRKLSEDAYNIKIHTIYRKLKRGVDIEMKEKKKALEKTKYAVYFIYYWCLSLFCFCNYSSRCCA